MANHRSAVKRNKQTTKKNERNKKLKSKMRSATKEYIEKIQAKDANSEELFKKVSSIINRTTSKGVLRKKTASRKISRLAKMKLHFSK